MKESQVNFGLEILYVTLSQAIRSRTEKEEVPGQRWR